MQLIKERDSLGNAVYPASNNGINYTGIIDMSKFYRAELYGQVGVLGASGSIAAGFQSGTTANGSDMTNMSGGNLSTNIAINNQQFTIELAYGASELASNRYVRGYLLVNTIASQCSLAIRGSEPRYGAQSSDDASVNVRLAF